MMMIFKSWRILYEDVQVDSSNTPPSLLENPSSNKNAQEKGGVVVVSTHQHPFLHQHQQESS